MTADFHSWTGNGLWDNACEDRRAHTRHDISQPAELRFGNRYTVVDALDVSSIGAKCRVVGGFAPVEGDTVCFVFLDGLERSGRVCWNNGPNIGIEFDWTIGDPMDQIWYEHMGIDYFRSIIRLQKFRQNQMPK